MPHPLHLAFIWHMHQPYYRDPVAGTSSMPWVRLHATKDYLDMVRRLDEVPAVHQTFNLVPSLLDQLEEYLPPENRSDVFLDLSKARAAELTAEQQRFVLQWFFLASLEHMIKPHPRYHDLWVKRGAQPAEHEWPKLQARFRVQDYLDLQVWFNLVWIDPWLRSQDAGLRALEARGGHFTEEEKAHVLAKQLELLAQVIPAYRAASARGQVELTTSPYFHPIMPLLCDTRSARVALPHLALPETSFRHPDDARSQLAEGLRRHEAAFGARAAGLWPPEGSVSEELVRLTMEAGLRWIATDEEILWRTLRSARAPSQLYKPHLLRRKAGKLAVIFRDRELSDLIGFVYGQWDPAIAVDDFLKRLGQIHEQFAGAAHPALVSIILDGENAWEHYAGDGHEFLTRLYQALAADTRFRCVTVSEHLNALPLDQEESLPELHSGSWIDGNFATWIGHPEKNAAWLQLARLRESLGPIDPADPARRALWRSVAAAEGSDWMWWYGDTHFSAQAEEFDRLFRAHLANAYQLAGLPAPAELSRPIRQKIVRPTHAPTGPVRAIIDGRDTSYYEWLYAGRLDLTQHYGAIHRGQQCLHAIAYGFDDSHHALRIDLDRAMLEQIPAWEIDLALGAHARIRIAMGLHGPEAHLAGRGAPLRCALGRVLEVAVPTELLDLQAGAQLHLVAQLLSGQELLERYPAQGVFELVASAAELEAQAWPV